jgi:hypothetical protein
MNSNTYSGWHNYETWNVNLWLTNDEGSYNYLVEMVNDASDEADLADRLESLICDDAPELTGIYGDLLTQSLRAIDFQELASAFWVDFREEEEQEEEEVEE